MEAYDLGDMLVDGPTMQAYAAWSKHYEKDVLLKIYKRSGIESAAPLIKEAIRQARAKVKESAVLTDVFFAPDGNCNSDDHFLVVFVLEKKTRDARDVVKRDDSQGRCSPGLSEYEVIEELKVPAATKVKLARVIATGQEVIIKTLENEKEITEANRFIREAFFQAYVEHERNCKLIDICFTKIPRSVVYSVHIVTERMESDLFADIKERCIYNRFYKEAELLSILQDVGTGLLHAKKLRIAHRDIKPHNIFLGSDNRVKLGDFGSTWKKGAITVSMSGAGTLDYVSPEMRDTMSMPDSHEADPFVSDVYSLGITLLHLALLSPPLNIVSRERRNIEMCLRRRLEEIEYSDDLKQLIAEMVAFEPGLRIKLDGVLITAEKILSQQPKFHENAEERKASIIYSAQVIAPAELRPAVNQAIEESKQVARVAPRLCQLTSNSVRFFNFEKCTWKDSVSLESEIPCDNGTSYAIDNETIYFFGNWERKTKWLFVDIQNGREAGKIGEKDRKFEIKRFPNMNRKRAGAGGIIVNQELILFGGYDSQVAYSDSHAGCYYTYNGYHKSGEVLSFSDSRSWTQLPDMSEGKFRLTPVLYHGKLYLSGFKNIDVFDITSRIFDPVLPLQLPEERWTDRVATLSGDELVIVTSKYFLRITLTSSPPTLTAADHEENSIEPDTSPVVFGDHLYWVSRDECKRASLHQPSRIETF